MKKCDTCNSSIFLGGTPWADWTCCNAVCLAKLKLTLTQRFIPALEIENQIKQVHQGACMQCQRHGPVDLYHSKMNTGMLVARSWSEQKFLCCASCAKAKQLQAAMHCLFFGWWSPTAFIANLFYLPYNLFSYVTTKSTQRPSPALTRMIIETMAKNNCALFVEKTRAAAAVAVTA